MAPKKRNRKKLWQNVDKITTFEIGLFLILPFF